jgi:hypothetical protein
MVILISLWRDPIDRQDVADLFKLWRNYLCLIPYLLVCVIPFFSTGVMLILASVNAQSSLLISIKLIIDFVSAAYLWCFYKFDKSLVTGLESSMLKTMSFVKVMSYLCGVNMACKYHKTLGEVIVSG